jgi:hypothetical protein
MLGPAVDPEGTVPSWAIAASTPATLSVPFQRMGSTHPLVGPLGLEEARLAAVAGGRAPGRVGGRTVTRGGGRGGTTVTPVLGPSAMGQDHRACWGHTHTHAEENAAQHSAGQAA